MIAKQGQNFIMIMSRNFDHHVVRIDHDHLATVRNFDHHVVRIDHDHLATVRNFDHIVNDHVATVVMLHCKLFPFNKKQY